MKQHDAVIEVMRANGGYATLGKLYQEALKVPGVEWKTKTPFSSINRIVQDARFFFRIRPGLWALKEFRGKLPDEVTDVEKPEYSHSYFQGLLVELGNLRKRGTFVPAQDRGKKFLARQLGEVATLAELYPFTYEDLVKRARSVDVVWFNERRMPDSFFEVEHTTNFDNSLLKFVQFQDFNIAFMVVASKNREKEFVSKIKHPAYTPIASRTMFRTYELLSDLHSQAHRMSQLEVQWAS
jgi:hypothetical protein